MTLRPELDCFIHGRPLTNIAFPCSVLSIPHVCGSTHNNPGSAGYATKLEKFSQKVLLIPTLFRLTQEVLSMAIKWELLMLSSGSSSCPRVSMALDFSRVAS